MARDKVRSFGLSAAALGLTTLLIAGTAAAAVAQTREERAGSADGTAAARDYCVSVGGQVVERHATWDTNADQSQWQGLGRTMETCRFETDDDSRIHVDLQTLYSEQLSLAAAAYLAMIPMAQELPAGNPATAYCADIGGTSTFGNSAAGGGWVWLDDPVDVVVAMCVFADGSAIDEWGLAYHSGGVIRGADLAPLFRSGEDYPPIYG
jgi:putative hemolysin